MLTKKLCNHVFILSTNLLNHRSAFPVVTDRLGAYNSSLPCKTTYEDGAQARSEYKVQQMESGRRPPHSLTFFQVYIKKKKGGWFHTKQYL